MPGYVVDPSMQPDFAALYAETGGEFVPAPGATYFVLTRNGVPQTDGTKYEAWDFANADAQVNNSAGDAVDDNAWGVAPVVSPDV